MNSVADVWQVVLERLRAGGLAETAISTWFDEVEAVAIRDMTFYLCCPNDFKRGTIESLFLPNLKAALKEIFSADFDVKLLSAAERSALGQEKPKKPTSLLESGEFTFDTFVVGDSNKLAYAAARAVADAPAEHYNPLFIYGDSGLGKTHLIYAIAHEIRTKTPNAKIVYIKGDDFTNELVEAIRTGKNVEFRSKYRDADLLLMDDVQFIAGRKQTQEEFFHTFNTLYESSARSSSPPTVRPRRCSCSTTVFRPASSGACSSTSSRPILKRALPSSKTRRPNGAASLTTTLPSTLPRTSPATSASLRAR